MHFGDLLILLFFAGNALCANYYVATNGNDGNLGTEAQPWLTLQKAADTMSAGDTALVSAGHYPEYVYARSNAIAFRGSGLPIVHGFNLRGQDVVVVGFSVRGTNLIGGIEIDELATNSLIVSNVFEQTPAGLVQLRSDNGNIKNQPVNTTILGNRFLDSPYYAVGLYGSGHTFASNYLSAQTGEDALLLLASNCRVLGNVWTNWTRPAESSAHTDLIQAFSNNGETSTNNLIAGNLFVNCFYTQIGQVSDLAIENFGTTNVHHWFWYNNVYANGPWKMSFHAPYSKFCNNVYYRCGTNTVGPIILESASDRGQAHSCEVFNNIFVECGSSTTRDWGGHYSVDASITNTVGDYNLVIGTGAGIAKTDFAINGRETHGFNGVDPLLTSGFQLAANSPCINAGTNLNALFATDYAGNLRGSQWDIGAYEFGSADPSAAGTNIIRALNVQTQKLVIQR